MDIATIIGLIATNGLIVYSILIGGSLGAFIDMPSVYIVIGGTLGAMLTNYPMGTMLGAAKVAMKSLIYPLEAPTLIIKRIVDYANQARRDGVLALEAGLQKEPDLFLRRGLQLVVDGQDVDTIVAILESDIDQMKKRHEGGRELFMVAATLAPAMGLIGTLIGLVLMLGNMSDPSSIGPSMAVALLTTFYGAMIANVFCMPIAGKLATRSGDEQLIRNLEVEGIRQIASGANPRLVEQQLFAFVAPKERKSQFS